MMLKKYIRLNVISDIFPAINIVIRLKYPLLFILLFELKGKCLNN